MSRLQKSKFIWSLAFTLLAVGCTRNDDTAQQTRFYENGQPKPIVALVPVMDSSRGNLSWDVAEEFSAGIHYRLMQKDRLYLVDAEKVSNVIK